MSTQLGTTERFTLYVRGNIDPTSIRVADLVKVLDAVDAAVGSIVMQDTPINPSEVFVALAAVQPGSVGLAFAPSLPTPMIAAWDRIIRTLNTDTTSSLPRRARDAIRRIVAFTKQYDCEAELRTEQTQALAVVTAQTVVVDAPPILGQTTLYGTLFRIGGRRQPTAWIATIGSGTIQCRVSYPLARELGAKLYGPVGVRGEAAWNATTLKIDAFKITEVLDYNPLPIDEAVAEMRQRYGEHFDKVDVDALMRQLRG
jgi:hypothetical protein